MLLRARRALVTTAARRSRSSARYASAQPLGKRGVTDGSEGITLFGTEAIQNGAAPAVTVFWLHGLGDTADGWAGAFVPGGGVTMPSPDYKVVLPTAETLPVTLNMGMQMPAWFDIYGLDAGAQVDEAGILKAAERLEALVAHGGPGDENCIRRLLAGRRGGADRRPALLGQERGRGRRHVDVAASRGFVPGGLADGGARATGLAPPRRRRRGRPNVMGRGVQGTARGTGVPRVLRDLPRHGPQRAPRGVRRDLIIS